MIVLGVLTLIAALIPALNCYASLKPLLSVPVGRERKLSLLDGRRYWKTSNGDWNVYDPAIKAWRKHPHQDYD